MIRFFKSQYIGRNLNLLVVITVLTLCTDMQTAYAQTRFAVRDTTPDVSKYVSMEDCLAGLERIKEYEVRKLPYWIDTVELVGGGELSPVAAKAKDFSARCLAKFNPDSVDLDNYMLWMRMYLSAGNDKAAELIAKRKLDESSWESSDSSKLLSRVIGGVVGEYRNAIPKRSQLGRAIIDFYLEDPNRPTSLEHIVNLYVSKTVQELDRGDTAAGKLWAHKVLAVIDSSAKLGRDSAFIKKSGSVFIAQARELIENDVLLDSLRVSGEAYAMLKHSIWKDTPNEVRESHINMIGEKARPLKGEFMYSRSGERLNNSIKLTGTSELSVASYPSIGKVSLVVFLYGGCRDEAPSTSTPKERNSHRTMCLDSYTIMRRIAKRYPEVDMTIVTKTMGYLGEIGPLAPENEADSLRSLWLDRHKLPARLLVENTEYFRLPGLDGRRVDHSYENSMNYSSLSPNKSGELPNKSVYLIDSDGTILLSGSLHLSFEKQAKEILDVITKRDKIVGDSQTRR